MKELESFFFSLKFLYLPKTASFFGLVFFSFFLYFFLPRPFLRVDPSERRMTAAVCFFFFFFFFFKFFRFFIFSVVWFLFLYGATPFFFILFFFLEMLF